MNYASKTLSAACCAILALPGCSKRPSAQPQADARDPSSSTPASAAAKVKIDACSLLISEEIESVQGEPVKETKSSSNTGRGFFIAQCYFALPTSSNSISLTVTQKSDGADARHPKEFWRETFHRDPDANETREKEKESGREEEKEEKKSPPQKIDGLGNEAFWMGTQVGTALYVLKGDCFLRISVGGAGDVASKLEKSKKLAGFALERL
jgi:hypothetical protein